MASERSLVEISALVDDELRRFEPFMREQMRSRTALLDTVVRYIMKQRGKRVRPTLVFLSAGLCAPISAAPKQLLWTQSADAAAPAVHGAGQSATTACSAIVCGPVSAAADRQDTTPRGAAHAP